MVKAIILCGTGSVGKTTTILSFINIVKVSPLFDEKFNNANKKSGYAIFERKIDKKIIVILPHGDLEWIIEAYFKEIDATIKSQGLPNYNYIIGTSKSQGATVKFYQTLLGNNPIYWLGKEPSGNLNKIEQDKISDSMALAISDLLAKI
ncbi:MAG: hypothetical protein LBQ34_05505 [Alphaproteobacteria bacterium]|jgi:hypothetical protein|nr:hypothetical protein [Alphaproteobacteria bacterium]